MNIAFFLVPKEEIIYLSLDSTMRQALERMEYHRYSAVPIIDKEGKYVGTMTEGDMLWKLKNTPGLTFGQTEKVYLKEIPRRLKYEPVRINARMDDLLSLAITQNFVPVIDDLDTFIGIIRRREIIEYYAKGGAVKLSTS
ncbi:MAG: CBS domain-containing protein [Bacillota bacterium]